MFKIGNTLNNTLRVFNSLSTDPIKSKPGSEIIYSVSHEGESTYLQLKSSYVPIVSEVVPEVNFELGAYEFLEGFEGSINLSRSGDLSQNSVVDLYILNNDYLRTSIKVEDILNAKKYNILFYIGETQKSIQLKSILDLDNLEPYQSIILLLRPHTNISLGAISSCVIDFFNYIPKITYSGFCEFQYASGYFVDFEVIPKLTNSGFCLQTGNYSIDYTILPKLTQSGYCAYDTQNDYEITGFTLLYCPHTAQNCYYTTTMASDPHWSNVIIFIQADGLNNGALVNEISDPINNPLIVSGLSTSYLTNARAKYGSKSAYFNGSDLLANIVPKVSGYSLTVNDFTFEFWAFVENATAGGTFGGLVNSTNNFVVVGLQCRFLVNTGRFETVVGGTSISPAIVCPSGQWFHYAVSRQGSTVRVFVNGVLNHSGTNSTAITISNTNTLRLGNGGGTTTWLNGHLDTIRFTNGVARYVANFNPETDTYLNTTITKGSPVCSSFYAT